MLIGDPHPPRLIGRCFKWRVQQGDYQCHEDHITRAGTTARAHGSPMRRHTQIPSNHTHAQTCAKHLSVYRRTVEGMRIPAHGTHALLLLPVARAGVGWLPGVRQLQGSAYRAVGVCVCEGA